MNAPARMIDRVIDAVREETKALRKDPGFDIHASSLRKHRLLLDLHHLPPGRVEPESLRTLREALDENGTELAARLAVSRRIADLVIDVAREDGCDGTYSAGRGRP